MATQPRRELKVGKIIDHTVDIVSRNATAALIYVVGLTVLGTAVEYVRAALLPTADPLSGINMRNVLLGTLLQIGLALFTIIAVYFLAETMLRSAGFRAAGGTRRYLPFIGMSLIVSICSALGLLVFIVPGLIFMARWSIATPLFISGGNRAFEAMGGSWNATRGHEFPIIGATLALLILFYAVSIGAGLVRGNDASILLIVVSTIAGNIGAVISAALGVAIYGLLPIGQQTAEVFE
jgi:hypothetical protein